jgi:hypothetical protein
MLERTGSLCDAALRAVEWAPYEERIALDVAGFLLL